jgi:hypothetical protein
LANGVGGCTDPERTHLLMQDATEQFGGDLDAEASRPVGTGYVPL